MKNYLIPFLAVTLLLSGCKQTTDKTPQPDEEGFTLEEVTPAPGEEIVEFGENEDFDWKSDYGDTTEKADAKSLKIRAVKVRTYDGYKVGTKRRCLKACKWGHCWTVACKNVPHPYYRKCWNVVDVIFTYPGTFTSQQIAKLKECGNKAAEAASPKYPNREKMETAFRATFLNCIPPALAVQLSYKVKTEKECTAWRPS